MEDWSLWPLPYVLVYSGYRNRRLGAYLQPLVSNEALKRGYLARSCNVSVRTSIQTRQRNLQVLASNHVHRLMAGKTSKQRIDVGNLPLLDNSLIDLVSHLQIAAAFVAWAVWVEV